MGRTYESLKFDYLNTDIRGCVRVCVGGCQMISYETM